jgi:hypothetical protein
VKREQKMSLPIPTSILEHVAMMDALSQCPPVSDISFDSSGASTVESVASDGTNTPKKRVMKTMDDTEICFLPESFCEEAKAPNSKFSIIVSLLIVGLFQEEL